MNRKIIFGIVGVVVVAIIAFVVINFINKNKEHDTGMWDEVSIGMARDEVIEKAYYRFDRDNCKKGNMDDEQIYIFEVTDFMGYKGQNARVTYLFDKMNKLLSYNVTIQAYTDSEYEKNIEEITEILLKHFKDKQDPKATDNVVLSDSKDKNYTHMILVENEMYSISYTNGVYMVSCNDFSDMIGGGFYE